MELEQQQQQQQIKTKCPFKELYERNNINNHSESRIHLLSGGLKLLATTDIKYSRINLSTSLPKRVLVSASFGFLLASSLHLRWYYINIFMQVNSILDVHSVDTHSKMPSLTLYSRKRNRYF